MSMVAYDVSAAGSLANAALCAPSPQEAPAAGSACPCAATAARAAAPVARTVCRTGWRRVIESLLALVSGPTLEQARRAASRV